MKIKIQYLLISFCFIALFSYVLFASAVIIDFHGEPGANKVTLYWSTLSEINCKGFKIERSMDKKDYKEVGFKKGAGNSASQLNYKFEDNTVYKSAVNRTFYYRIKIVDMDGKESVFSTIISVTPSISGARYTWGSIKALFR